MKVPLRTDSQWRRVVILVALVFALSLVVCVLHGDHQDPILHDLCAGMAVVQIGLGVIGGLLLAGRAPRDQFAMAPCAPVYVVDPPPRASVLV